MKSIATLLLLVASGLVFLGSTSPVSAYSGGFGIAGLTSTSSQGCKTCHGGAANPATTVSIVEGATTTVAPGSTASFTIQVAHSSQVGAGVAIAVKTTEKGETNAGTLAPAAGSGLQNIQGELTHTTTKPMTGGTASFTFTWTAPTTPGTYYVRAIGNAVNGNSQSTGDVWNWMTPVAITVSEGTSVEEQPAASLQDIKVSPNPATDNVKIEIKLTKPEVADILVVNSYGEIVQNLAKGLSLYEGANVIQWNSRNMNQEPVPSGMYKIVIRTGGNITTMPVAVVQ